VGWANCTTSRNPTLADLAQSAFASDKKLITYQFKRGFLWVCIEEGARSFVGRKKETRKFDSSVAAK